MCLVLFLSLASFATGYAGVSGPIRVIDGDTFEIDGTRVRLFGIDAPETDQTCTRSNGTDWHCGAWVNEQVTRRFGGQPARCEAVDTDRYGRVVARCYVGRQDVAEALVDAGLAFAYRRYSMDYAPAERRAARADAGLHAGRVQRPDAFRKARSVATAAPSGSCVIKGNISGKGTRIFHSPGQRDYERTVISPDKGERWFCNAAEARAAGWRAARR